MRRKFFRHRCECADGVDVAAMAAATDESGKNRRAEKRISDLSKIFMVFCLT